MISIKKGGGKRTGRQGVGNERNKRQKLQVSKILSFQKASGPSGKEEETPFAALLDSARVHQDHTYYFSKKNGPPQPTDVYKTPQNYLFLFGDLSTFSPKVQELMTNALQPNTVRQYATMVRRFVTWKQTVWSPKPAHESMLYEYLAPFATEKFSFSYFKSIYCAIRFYMKRAMPLVEVTPHHCDDFISGAQKKCKKFLKQMHTWDPQIYLDFLTQRPIPNKAAAASREAAAILALAKGLRSADLMNITTVGIKFNKGVSVFLPYIDRTKCLGPHGEQLPGITVAAYRLNPRICPVELVDRYLKLSRAEYKRRKPGPDGWPRPAPLFVSSTAPKVIEPSTLRNWLCEEIAEAGIVGPEGKRYSAHSFRAATTSADYFKHFSFDRIKECVGWRHESTFARHYRRKIYNPIRSLLDHKALEEIDPAEDLAKAPLQEEEAKADGFCFSCYQNRCMTPIACANAMKRIEESGVYVV